jgi:hypothetical protein
LRRRVALIVVLVGVAAAALLLHTKRVEKSSGLITAREYQKLLGVGLAVDWTNYPRINYWYFYWRSRGVSIPEMIREQGFTHVRIRVGAERWLRSAGRSPRGNTLRAGD